MAPGFPGRTDRINPSCVRLDLGEVHFLKAILEEDLGAEPFQVLGCVPWLEAAVLV